MIELSLARRVFAAGLCACRARSSSSSAFGVEAQLRHRQSRGSLISDASQANVAKQLDRLYRALPDFAALRARASVCDALLEQNRASRAAAAAAASAPASAALGQSSASAPSPSAALQTSRPPMQAPPLPPLASSMATLATRLPRGLYLHGPVGCGKTMLLDMLFDCARGVPVAAPSEAQIALDMGFVRDAAVAAAAAAAAAATATAAAIAAQPLAGQPMPHTIIGAVAARPSAVNGGNQALGASGASPMAGAPQLAAAALSSHLQTAAVDAAALLGGDAYASPSASASAAAAAVPRLLPARRVHFHKFMSEVHRRIHEWKLSARLPRDVRMSRAAFAPERDAIAAVARDIAREAWLLCFDEFHVTDAADAIILGRVFSHLFRAGTVVVATSNTPPGELYMGGLNRDDFMPFVATLISVCKPVHMDGVVDYRRVEQRPSFAEQQGGAEVGGDDDSSSFISVASPSPLDIRSTAATTTSSKSSRSQSLVAPSAEPFRSRYLSGPGSNARLLLSLGLPESLSVPGVFAEPLRRRVFELPFGRSIALRTFEARPRAADAHAGVLVDFDEICGRENPLSAADYAAIAKAFGTVVLTSVPKLDLPLQLDAARRLVSLVDELYDFRVELFVAAACPLEGVFSALRVQGSGAALGGGLPPALVLEAASGRFAEVLMPLESPPPASTPSSSPRASPPAPPLDDAQDEHSADPASERVESMASASLIDLVVASRRAESRLFEMSGASYAARAFESGARSRAML